MPTVFTTSHETLRPKRWTRQHCIQFEAAGIFNNERLELVCGELISKAGKNRPHVNAFTIMHLWFLEAFGKQFVNAEAPIDVSPEDNPSSEPEPDLIVLNREWGTFVSANPQPKDLRLVIEVADTTLDFDLSVKAALYARAGIIEYWVLDVNSKRLFCHRDPVGAPTAPSLFTTSTNPSPLSAHLVPPFLLHSCSDQFLSPRQHDRIPLGILHPQKTTPGLLLRRTAKLHALRTQFLIRLIHIIHLPRRIQKRANPIFVPFRRKQHNARRRARVSLVQSISVSR